MNRKLVKLGRYWRWRLKSANRIPLFWHVGRPNFGDDINPTFYEQLTGARVRFATNMNRPHLLGAGSILEKATPSSIIVGSGLLSPLKMPLHSGYSVVSVRGEKTLEIINCKDSILLGDPLVLIDLLVDAPNRKIHEIGVVPHITNVQKFRSEYGGRAHIIDPALPPFDVVAQIGACEKIMSQSLHGLIVADALKVPNVWLSPGVSMIGGDFKFIDYFSTLDSTKEAINNHGDAILNPTPLPFQVSKYRYDKNIYRDVLSAAMHLVNS